jgi:hypothetical protein
MPKRSKSASGGSRRVRRRDYHAEYLRRVQRGVSKGLSLSQARGHARAGERAKPPNRIPVNPKNKEEVAIRIMRDTGASLRYTAQLTRQSEQHLRRYIKEHVNARRVGNRWILDDQRPRQFPFYSNGMLVSPWLTPHGASSASLYMHAWFQFRGTGELSYLEPYAGQGVTDIKGKFHPFEVDPNRLYELDAKGELNFPEFYRIIN